MSPMFRQRPKSHKSSQDGYVLLMLLLVMATMAIAMAVAIPSLTFEMRRDREAELIHRGTQYSRAVRAYFKKFGRYPTKIEDLESSNNMRFLRKRYKDPLNCTGSLIPGDPSGATAAKCQDFKLLHFGEVQLSMSGIGGSMIPGATAAGAAMNAAGLAQSALGQSALAQSALGQSSSFGQSSFGQGSSAFGGSSTFGNSGSFGQSSTQTPGDSSQPGQNGTDNPNGGTENSGNSQSNQIGSGQIIGAPIVGVASATKDKESTIREFNHKRKYKDWMFVYDPSQDRGTLITTPYQQIQVAQQNLNGSSNSSSGSGQPPAGMQNNPNLPSSGFGNFGNSNQSSSFGNSSQSNSSPQQQ
jgi:type II secretory pathway pseudopilin PulG